MSFSTQAVGGAKEDLIVSIPATDDASGTANATPEADVTGASTTSTFFWAEIDCRGNPNENGELRIYAKATAVTVGNDDSEITLRGVRGKKITYNFPVGIIMPLATAVAYVLGLGATANSTNPTGTVKLRLGFKT